MADNYLEKKYRDLFGDHTVVNPETGFAEQKNSGLKIPKPVKKKNRTDIILVLTCIALLLPISCSKAQQDKPVSEVKSYRDLWSLVDTAEPGSTIALQYDYEFNPSVDNQLSDSDIDYYNFIEGINISKDLTIDMNGHSISGGHHTRAFQLYDRNCTLALKNGTIKDCYIENRTGGAIANYYGSSLTCENILFDNCKTVKKDPASKTACSGGAVFCLSGNFRFTDCKFKRCSASSNGGALLVHWSNVIIDHCEFTSNKTSGNGGAIYSENFQTLSIESSVFENNEAAGAGGAVYFMKAYPLMDNHLEMRGSIKIRNNTAPVCPNARIGAAPVFITGPLAGSDIHYTLTLQEGSDIQTPGVLTRDYRANSGSDNPASFFHHDGTIALKQILNQDGEIELVK